MSRINMLPDGHATFFSSEPPRRLSDEEVERGWTLILKILNGETLKDKDEETVH